MNKENKPADKSAKKTKNISNLKDQKVEGKQVKGGAIKVGVTVPPYGTNP